MNNMLNLLPFPSIDKVGWPWTEETDASIYNNNLNWPRISIVTPSFNQGDFIEETIRSILLQNYPNLEYIIMDGGSSDDSVAIIERYEKWITYWESKKDRGQTHAINKGISRSSGIIFNWINSDDSLTKEALYKIAMAYLSNNHLNIFIGSAKIVNMEDNSFSLSSRTTVVEDYNSIGKYLANYNICQPATFLKLDKIKEVGALDETFNCMMDGDLMARIFIKNGLQNYFIIDDYLCKIYYHSNTKTSTLEDNFFQDNLRIRTFLLNRLKEAEWLRKYKKRQIEKIEQTLSFYLNLHKATFNKSGWRLFFSKLAFVPKFIWLKLS